MEMDKRKAIAKPVIHAAIIMAVFYAIEIAMVYLDVFPDYNMLLGADIILRIVFGTVSLVLLRNYSKRGESKFTVKQLFTNRIPKGTWIVLIPFILYIIAPFIKLFTAYIFTTNVIVTLSIVIFQQFAVGFFEEATQRGLLMNGLIKHNTGTVKQRLFTVFITGAFFGLTHVLNIFFGENPLLQVPAVFLEGMFIAAVYMLSDNLLLVMVLHTLSDSTFRIVNGLFGYVHDAPVCQAVGITRNIITYAVLPVLAVLICVFYDKIKKLPATEGKSHCKEVLQG
jgi:membrane protease YdiL (CAAX protease family)